MDPKPRVIFSVFEGNNYEIGACVADSSNHVIRLFQFNDDYSNSKLISKINLINPSEVCLSEKNSRIHNISSILREHYKSIKINFVNAKSFDALNGFDLLAKIHYKELYHIKSRKVVLAAFSALIDYLKLENELISNPGLIRVEYVKETDRLFIDATTSKYIELLSSLNNKKRNKSLFQVLNSTITKNGLNMLRSNLAEPLYNLDLTNERLNAIQSIISDTELQSNLEKILKESEGIDEIIHFFHQYSASSSHEQREYNAASMKISERKFKIMLRIRNSLNALDILEKEVNMNNELSFLRKSHQSLINDRRFLKIKQEIDRIADFKSNKMHKLNFDKFECGFSIKPKINDMLDLARRTLIELLDHISDYCVNLSKSVNLPIKIDYASKRDFFLKIKLKAKNKLMLNDDPAESRRLISELFRNDKIANECIKERVLKQSIQFTTKTLLNLNERVNETKGDIFQISNNILDTLLKEWKKEIDFFYKLSDTLSQIDMLLSLASYSCKTVACSRPYFGSQLSLKSAAHPILFNLKKTDSNEFILNDIEANATQPFNLIMGANTSGKSTLVKQIGLLQIMSQLGCYVPAEKAVFNPKMQIISRAGEFQDKLDLSSFQLEMKELSHMLDSISDNSLILIDELCRSTNPKEGLALSLAICEYILNEKIADKQNVYAFYATHFEELKSLEIMYSKVKCCQLDSYVDESTSRIRNTFKLKNDLNFSNYENYGISLIALSLFPDKLANETRELISYFKNLTQSLFEVKSNQMRIKLVKSFYNQLVNLDYELMLTNDKGVDYLEESIRNFEDKYLEYK